MGELRGQYARDGDAVVKLLKRSGRKWKRIRVLRMRQRRTMLRMMQKPCATRAMCRTLRVVDVRRRSLLAYEQNAETAAIYVQCHPTVRHAYVGQHAGVAHTRKEQHDRYIWKAQRRQVGEEDQKGAQPWHAYAARNGGVAGWIDLPVRVFDVDTPQHEVNRCERLGRTAVGDLCVAGNKWSSLTKRAHQRKQQRRRRPVSSIRKQRARGEKEAAKGEWMTSLKCVVGEQRVRTTQLAHALHLANTQRCSVTVRVRPGQVQATNWVTLRRTYGESSVRLLTATGRTRRVRLRQVQQSMLTTGVPLKDRIVLLHVRTVKVRERGDAELNSLVQVLGNTRAGGEKELRSGGFKLLEALWSRVRTLTDKRKREIAQGRLSGRALRVWGVSLRARPVLRVPGDTVFPVQCARRAGLKLLDLLGQRTRPQVARLQRRLRVVREKPSQVGSNLVNWRKWCVDEYVPGCEPDCKCSGWKGLRSVHKLEGHLAMRGRDYKGPGARAMRCSAKTVVASDAAASDELRRDVRRCVKGLVASLPAQLRHEVTEDMINSAVRTGNLQPGDRKGGGSRPVPGEPTHADIAALRTEFEGMVVSEIDKERGELAVL